MNWQRELRDRFDRAGASPPDEVIDELAEHAATAFGAARDAGASESEARANVLALVETWSQSPREYVRRPARPMLPPAPPVTSRGLPGVWMDLVYGLRLLRRQPGTALLAFVTMALAVGSTTMLASVAYGVLARPLPWPDADRLIRVFESREGSSRRAMPILTNAAYHAWLPHAVAIDRLAGFASGTVTLGGGPEPERVQRATVTASLLPMLGAVPVHGRLLTDDDDRSNAAVALISHPFWQRRFDAARSPVGEVITVEGVAVTIIGVLPAGFDFPNREVALWMPMPISAINVDQDSHSVSVQMFTAMARLAPGATPAQAAEEATRLARQGPSLGMVGVAVFGSDGAPVVTTRPLMELTTEEVRPALLLLLAGVGLLFTTAIAGLATLQVARWLTRQREMAVRAAIGAGHGRLTRQMLVEQIIVGLSGGLAGLGLAWLLHRAAPSILPASFPRLDAIVLDWRIAALAIALALVATVLTSVLPIARVLRLPLSEVLSRGGRSAAASSFGGALSRGRAVVIAAQVAMTVVLLVGAGLVTRSFVALTEIDRGFRPEGRLTAQLASGPGRRTATARMALAERVVERLESLPSVERAAFASALPFMPGATLMGFTFQPQGEAAERMVQAEMILTSDGLVDALGLTVTEGRGFAPTDTATSEPVAIVTQAFAREFLRTRALGTMLPLALGPTSHDAKVIGVVNDLARPVVTETPPPQIFLLASQAGALGVGDMRIVARTVGEPLGIVPALQSIVREVDDTAAVESVRTMTDRLSASLSQPRLNAMLLGGFAGFALLVAGVGLFGALSQGVSSRRRELGVRLALGATPAGVIRLVVLQGLRIAGAGLVAGLIAAGALAGTASSLLFGVTPRDPASYGVVAIVVLAATALACFVPARRAATVDPLTALRE